MFNDNMMDDVQFWTVIGMIDWDYEDNEERVEPLVEYLCNEGVETIKKFEETLSYKLYQLDTIYIAKNIGEGAYVSEDEYFSADTFLYARCAVIANGQEVFENVLADATEFPQDDEFEELLYVASDAYNKLVNDDFIYLPGYNSETYSNKEGWNLE